MATLMSWLEAGRRLAEKIPRQTSVALVARFAVASVFWRSGRDQGRERVLIMAGSRGWGCCRSVRGPAAVDRQRGAGDRGGSVAAQEHGERTDLLDRCEAFVRLLLQEDVADHLLPWDVMGPGLLGDLLLDQRRPDVAGADGVAGDAVSAASTPYLGQPDHAVLGGDIGRLERRGDQTVRRGDVDDAAPFVRPHRGEREARRVERRGEVDREDRVPFRGGNASIGATCWMPALLTRMSSRPTRDGSPIISAMESGSTCRRRIVARTP